MALYEDYAVLCKVSQLRRQALMTETDVTERVPLILHRDRYFAPRHQNNIVFVLRRLVPKASEDI